MTPLVSVITATRNRPDELWRAYNSLLEQTYTNWEWVIVDDHSACLYADSIARQDNRVSFLEAGHLTGKAETRNLGLEAAKGEWTTFLDDDDELLPIALASLVRSARTYRYAPMVYRAKLVLQDAHGTRRAASTYYRRRDLWIRYLFAITNIGGYIMPTDLARSVWFRDTRYFQDADFFLRAICYVDTVEVDEFAYVYHRYGPSGSAKAYLAQDDKEVLALELTALEQLFDFPHPAIQTYRREGIYDLAVAARYIWHATAFPQVSAIDTYCAALRASRRITVWVWLARFSYLRVERHLSVLTKLREAFDIVFRVQKPNIVH